MAGASGVISEVYGKQGTTHCAMRIPSPALAACVRAYVSRTTVGAELKPDEQCNHFPAAPACIFVWVVQGYDTRLACIDGASAHAVMPVVFAGPYFGPSVTQNAGEVRFFSLLMYPDALQALTGLDIATHLNRYSALDDVFDAPWQEMARKVLDAPDDETRVRLIEAFLTPRWEAVRPGATAGPALFTEWSSNVADRAAGHASGRSDRQVDRRINAWTGQALRQLRRIGRAEEALLRARPSSALSMRKWSDIAAECGFSDQAHLSREIRRITGLPPDGLKKVISHESYWLYRLWGLGDPTRWPQD